MMLQWILHVIPWIAFAGMIYFTSSLSACLKEGSFGMTSAIGSLLESTPALDAFFIVLVRALVAVGTGVFLFGRVSNHCILNLDILYFYSLILLILYHTLKVFLNPLVKNA